MLRGVLARLGVALGLGFLAGCSRPAARYVERVTDDGQGAFWLAGSEGYLARVDGNSRGQFDYPRLRGSPDGATYEHSVIPAARVVIRQGTPYLFTRPGEVYVWAQGAWSRLSIDFPTGGLRQLDEVLLTDQGEWIFFFHSPILLRASHEDFLAGRFTTETLPTYVTWLGLLDHTLYGLGWEGSTSKRAIYKREAASRWATIPTDLDIVYGLIRTPQAEIAAVTDDGLLIVEQEGQPLPTPRVRKILGPGSFFQTPITLGSRTLLPIIGRDTGLLEIQPGGLRIWRFPEGGQIVGAISRGASIGAVQMSGEVLPPIPGEPLGASVKEIAQ